MIKDEIFRRYSIDTEISDGQPRKSPTLSGNLKTLVARLARVVGDDGKQTFPLKYKYERKWIKSEIESVLVSIKIAKQKEEIRNMENGDHLKNETHLKMRLIHGEYYFAYRSCIHITKPIITDLNLFS